jgi:hypothetical protein
MTGSVCTLRITSTGGQLHNTYLFNWGYYWGYE